MSKCMNSLWIRYGGSNRKMYRDQATLKAKFPEFREVGSTGTGHWSNRTGVINDTEENRAIIKSLKGITIDRKMNSI